MNATRFFHQFKTLRKLAKILGRKINIKQKFHSGYIFLNAVEHSWAWTGNINYNNFDVELQNYIHQASIEYDYFIDIGSNIGVMTIGTLLTNHNIKAVAIDPNHTAINLLKKSLKYNNLQDRSKVINAVAGDYDGTINFNSEGSVIGHVSENGTKTNIVKTSSILNQYSNYKSLVKIDIEGYESKIIDELTLINNIQNFRFIIELHEDDFNDVGNPQYVFNKLRNLNAIITDFSGNILDSVPQNAISQISVTFN